MLSGVVRTEKPSADRNQPELGHVGAVGRSWRVCGAIEPTGFNTSTSR